MQSGLNLCIILIAPSSHQNLTTVDARISVYFAPNLIIDTRKGAYPIYGSQWPARCAFQLVEMCSRGQRSPCLSPCLSPRLSPRLSGNASGVAASHNIAATKLLPSKRGTIIFLVRLCLPVVRRSPLHNSRRIPLPDPYRQMSRS